MTDSPGTTRREFLLQSAVLAGSMVAARSVPLLGEMAEQQGANPMLLWYAKPASQWVEALPIGNGRLGAMVFGGIERERLQLNDDTLWSGGPRDWNNPNGPKVLAEVRRLIAAERYVEADVAIRGMQGPFTQSYLPMGDLRLTFEHGDHARGGYRRELDLARAVTQVRYRVGATTYTREIFASRPDQAIVIRLTADRPGMISFTAAMDSQLRHTLIANGGVLELHGRAPSNVDPSYHDRDAPRSRAASCMCATLMKSCSGSRPRPVSMAPTTRRRAKARRPGPLSQRNCAMRRHGRSSRNAMPMSRTIVRSSIAWRSRSTSPPPRRTCPPTNASSRSARRTQAW
jgi:hypothetical protein